MKINPTEQTSTFPVPLNKLKGNLASTFNWGSLLLWELYPQNLISIDGRYEEEIYDYIDNELLGLTNNNNRFQERIKKLEDRINLSNSILIKFVC